MDVGGGLSKICHTYPILMKLGTVVPCLKKIQIRHKSRDTSIAFCWHENFFTKKQQFLVFLVFESSKVALVKMVEFLMMSAKWSTLGLLKIYVFWNKGYDIITSVCHFANKIESFDSNYIVDVIMWPKFGNSSISMREVIITSIL